MSRSCNRLRHMILATTSDAPVNLEADLLLVSVPKSTPAVDGWIDDFGSGVRRALGDFDAAVGDARVVSPEHTAVRRCALPGVGPATEVDAETLPTAGAAGGEAVLDHKPDTVACLLPEDGELPDDRAAQVLVEGILLGSYQYRRYKSADGFEGPSAFVVSVRSNHNRDAVDAGMVDAGMKRGRVLARASCSARDLVNRSPDEKTARQFADVVADSGAAHRGSFDPPTFSALTWAPADAVNEHPIVLVGKGVVFDTGGLSLKKTKNSMDMMKADLGGAAAIMGAFEALAELEVPLHVVGLLPATDNRPGRKAYVPGDVVRMHSGATVEVMNTDAEGRLLLADALSYTDRYEPELVVDLATLSGSCIVAFGQAAAGVLTSETDAAAERLYAIQRAGEWTGERVHPPPVYRRVQGASGERDCRSQKCRWQNSRREHGGQIPGALCGGRSVAAPRHCRACFSNNLARAPSGGWNGTWRPSPGRLSEHPCSDPSAGLTRTGRLFR